MKTTVEKIIAKLTDLRVEERDLQKRLDDNRRDQAAIISSLQVKPERTQVRRVIVPKPRKTAAKVFPSHQPSPSPQSVQSGQAVPGAALVRQYIAAADDDAIFTTESVAKATGIPSPVASTALSRLTGKMIERVPGSKRGKFRKINRAA